MEKKLTRRQFLLTALSAGAVGFIWLKNGSISDVAGAGELPPIVYLPMVNGSLPTATPVPTATPTKTPTTVPPNGKPRVVRVHHNTVTTWNFSGSYWDAAYLSQAKTTAMVENGVKMLTSTATVANAWRALLPNYQAGQRIAIKVNFNNTMDDACGSNPSQINALPQVIMPIIAGLKAIGVVEANIGIYDGVDRKIPPYFYNPIHAAYPGVVFYDKCHTSVGLSSQSITFSPPGSGSFTQKIAKPAEDATYLINVPIMKNHSNAGITLGFKNHFGTVENPYGLHSRTFVTDEGSQYRSDYNPLVDIMKSPLIGPKTVLTLGDGIYGALGQQDVDPDIWPNTFDDFPKSLFFAKDPVAIDSVMADFLDAEYGNWANSSRYLVLAQSAGLGVYEHVSNPLTNPAYTKIDYQLVNLT